MKVEACNATTSHKLQEKAKLNLMTFNIWIKETHREARINKLVDIIKENEVSQPQLPIDLPAD